MSEQQQTPRYDLTLKRNATLRWSFRFKNKLTGVYENLTGSTFKVYVEPRSDDPEFVIEASGPDDQKLIITPLEGRVTVLIAKALVTAFEWDKAEYRVEQVDTLGDTQVRLAGVWTFESVWAD